MKVGFKKVKSYAMVPAKASKGAAAYDLYASEEAYIGPLQTLAIGVGIALEIPEGWKGEVYSRSGMAKKGIVVANSPGKIDSDYRGEIFVLLHNTSMHDIAGIKRGDRIAQFEINPCHEIEFQETLDLTSTKRGEKGFGSTGK
jgi:dUTP pyrophosphatase